MNQINEQIGIYKFENNQSHKIYIGQSTYIKKRYYGHLYDAYNRPEHCSGVDPAIAKYGINNFTFSIIENCPIEKLDEREIYWIAYYDSYHNGYNRTPGGKALRGENHPRALLTEKDVWMIREMYNNKESRRNVYKMFQESGITKRGFKKIWDGENWPTIHMDVYTLENKKWHKENTGHREDQIGFSSLDRAIKQPEIDAMVADHLKGLNVYQLSIKYGRDCGIISKYLSNPKEIEKINYRGRKIKNLNTEIIFNSISSAAKWAGCGATTLTRHLTTDKIAGKVPETNEPAIWEEIL